MNASTIIQTETQFRQRRFFVVLPLLIVPFVTVTFWLMGGGVADPKQNGEKKTGLNTQLPQAQTKIDSAKDKLTFYDAADADSAKRKEQIRMDPYRKDSVVKPLTHNNIPAREYKNENGQNINEKIEQIRRQLSGVSSHSVAQADKLNTSASTAPVVERVASQQTDPEIAALNGTLEKILEIQHPERVKEKLPQKNATVFVVTSEPAVTDDTFFGQKDSAKKAPTFYQEKTELKSSSDAIQAVIDGEQILKTGALVKLRLLTDVYINGTRILSGSFIYGTAVMENERLKVHISSIRYENILLPVSLMVYDIDGLEGIYIPGSATREVLKESAEQGIESAGGLSFDASFKAQAIAAGIGAAKNLLRKKIKENPVTVKAGYKVLLRDQNQQNP